MGSVTGKIIKISVFGESHGEGIGAVIDGFPHGVPVDLEFINSEIARRKPSKGVFSTSRNEADAFEIISGVCKGFTTGAPISVLIKNSDTRSADYDELRNRPRPSHADYTAGVRYGGFQDARGGGHFSGRLTAPLVFAGALCKLALLKYDIKIIAHIAEVGGVRDEAFALEAISPDITKALEGKEFRTLSEKAAAGMLKAIENARSEGDSAGGIVECAVLGAPAGLGSPMFEGIENRLAAAIFAIPGVKGIEFGAGFDIARMRGSAANDSPYFDGGALKTKTNNSGGICGGITNGMPIIFRAAIKPTPSIAREQETVDMKSKESCVLSIKGRHDPCIVPRALPVIEAIAAAVTLDLMLEKNGYGEAGYEA